MNKEKTGEALDIVSGALERDPDERQAFIEDQCAGDPVVRAEVDRLLALSKEGEEMGFLEQAPELTVKSVIADPVLGKVIGPYKILESLGEGGMGVVYLAEQTEPIQRRVALKLIKPGMDTRQVIARFETERQALATMDHPNVAKVFEAGSTDQGRPYFVMEHVAGVPVTEHCDQERLNIDERLELFVQICHAVQHAHQKGVIHRDLKPSNILVAHGDGQDTGASWVPKVIDFGVAKAIDQKLTEETAFTEHDQLVGTPAYMSPEQAKAGPHDVDTRSDIYSLGVLLYELLAGALPFDPKSLRHAAFEEIRHIIRDVDPPKPSTKLDSSIPQQAEQSTTAAHNRRVDPRTLIRRLRGDLDWITLKALEKERSRRYSTAADFAADIQRHLRNEPVIARPPSTVYRISKFARRNKGFVAAASCVFAALSVGLIGVSVQRQEAIAARKLAQESLAAVETVSDFQADMLGGLTPEDFGRNVVAAIRRHTEQALRRRGTTAKESQGILNSVVDSLAIMNEADVGREIISENLLRPASEAIAQSFSDQPLVAARLRHALGRNYHQLGMYAEAERELNRAYEIFLNKRGKAGRDTLDVMCDLGGVHTDDGAYEKAESLCIEGLVGAREALGESDVITLRLMSNLAYVYRHQGRFAEAETLYTQALDLKTRHLGETHGRTLLAMNNLADLYLNWGKPAKAEVLCEQAISLGRRVQDSNVPLFMFNLALAYRTQGRWDDAAKLHEEELAHVRARHGENHPSTAISMCSLADVYVKLQRFDEAERLFVRALEFERRALGDMHIETQNTMNNLADLYLNMKEHDKARDMFVRTLQASRASLGDDHPNTLITMLNLANIYRGQSQFDEAERLCAEAAEGFGQQTSPMLTEKGVALSWRGRALVQLTRFQEAETSLTEAFQLLASELGEDHSRTVKAVRSVVQLYEAWDKPEAAESWRQKLTTEERADDEK